MASGNVKTVASDKAGQSPDPVIIDIVEVSPRDGLQNEKTPFSTSEKLELINYALKAGVKRIEVTSFVNPKRVPQMADADEVARGLPKRDGVRYTGLVMNQRGAERALLHRHQPFAEPA